MRFQTTTRRDVPARKIRARAHLVDLLLVEEDQVGQRHHVRDLELPGVNAHGGVGVRHGKVNAARGRAAGKKVARSAGGEPSEWRARAAGPWSRGDKPATGEGVVRTYLFGELVQPPELEPCPQRRRVVA